MNSSFWEWEDGFLVVPRLSEPHGSDACVLGRHTPGTSSPVEISLRISLDYNPADRQVNALVAPEAEKLNSAGRGPEMLCRRLSDRGRLCGRCLSLTSEELP
jgi:hypothetical protein